MPPVGDLHRLRSALGGALAIATATVAADDLDAGMGREPVRDSATFPVRQEIDGAATLEVTNDRPIILAIQLGEVVNAECEHRMATVPRAAAGGAAACRRRPAWRGVQ